MDLPNWTTAQRIAQAATAFEDRQTGHLPQSVSVVLREDTLVITLQGVLSPAEKALAKSPTGAVEVQEFHRQLFATASDLLLQDIKRIMTCFMFFGQCCGLFWRVPGEPADVETAA
jgi:uncharacterized protein YbcI